MLRRRTIRGPSTGLFHTPVCTVRPRQDTSFGIPTLRDSRVVIRHRLALPSPGRHDPRRSRTVCTTLAVLLGMCVTGWRSPFGDGSCAWEATSGDPSTSFDVAV